MSIYYSKFDLNTYRCTPYFRAHIPPDYPLSSVLTNARAFRRLPPHLRQLAGKAKAWARRNYPVVANEMERWYDDDGYELDPDTGRRLTDAEIDAQWPWDKPDIEVEDIPLPVGGFADPDTWEEPPPPPEEPDPSAEGPPTREQLLRDIESHGYERTADEYGIPIDQLPRSDRRAFSINEEATPEHLPDNAKAALDK